MFPGRAISDLVLLRFVSLVTIPASFVWDLAFAMTGEGTCPSSRFLGVDCPACGLTRGFVAVANADIVLSLQYNLAAPLLWAGFAGVLVHWAAESAGGRWRASWMGPLVALWMLAVLLVLLVGWARHLLH